jgi:hypothetical protein
MLQDFDFNIDNYSTTDIENFLNLGETYNQQDIDDKCIIMKNIIIKSKDYDNNYKNRLGNFLEQSKIKLLTNMSNNNSLEQDYDKLLIPTDEGKVINKTTTTYAGHTYVMNKETASLNDVINTDKYLDPIETYTTNISRSNLNNLKRKTILQTIVLNTLFREDYFNTTSSDFTIVLPYYFKNVFSLRLSSLQLPNVIYTISKSNGNNTFYIEEDITGINGTITFPDGNYANIIDFCTLLETEINTQLGISPYRFIVTCDSYSGKITISNNTNNFTMIFNTSLNTIYGKCGKQHVPTNGDRQQNCVELEKIYKQFGWIIGYRNEIYSQSNSYTTEAIYNGAYPNYIYFVLNDYNNSQAQNVFGMYSKSIIGDNILGMIPITSQDFVVNFTNGSDFIEKKREYFGPVRIQRIKIQLLNQFGDTINLNNMDYSFSLELEIGYDY